MKILFPLDIFPGVGWLGYVVDLVSVLLSFLNQAHIQIQKANLCQNRGFFFQREMFNA